VSAIPGTPHTTCRSVSGLDLLDNRIGCSSNSQTHYYVNERGHQVLEFDADGTVRKRQLWAPGVDRLLAIDGGNDSIIWTLTDHHGSIRTAFLSDAAYDQFEYDPSGVVTIPDAEDSHLGALQPLVENYYAGRECDPATGLYFNRARWYDPASGRFISEDPIGFAAGDANLYRYCGNSPTNATDPTGQFIISGTVLLVGGISLLIGGASTAALYHAADQYDEASDILGIPTAELTQADIDRYGQLIDSARTWQAAGEVGGYTALAIAGAPVAAAASGAYVGGMTAAFGTFGTSAAVTSLGTIAASGFYSVGAEAVAVAQDWNEMDNIDRFHRVGLLGGPFVGAMGSGYLTRSWAAVGYQRGFTGVESLKRGLSAVTSSALSKTSQVFTRLSRGAQLRQKYGHLSPTQRQARITELSEANYLRRIQEIEANYGAPGIHSLQKHGAQTTALSQYRRVSRPSYPNPATGAAGNPTKNASKFLTHRDHYETLVRSLQARAPGQTEVPVHFDRVIGVSIRNLGTHANRGPYSLNRGVTSAVVRFAPDGRIISAFPNP